MPKPEDALMPLEGGRGTHCGFHCGLWWRVTRPEDMGVVVLPLPAW